MNTPFRTEVTPGWEALLSCIQRKGTPRRVHPIELEEQLRALGYAD